ncbi:MAG TPA: glycoside hydrolase family 27 protein, partial [Gemmatimonadales bacterium]|nr:glycoside hydrolase family 27 protein [Gemmatimonadales bacterium]
MRPAVRYFALASALLAAPASLRAQADRIELPRARFATGDDSAWSAPDFADTAWKEISTLANFEGQGFEGYDGYVWYRIHVVIPSSIRASVHWQKRLEVYLSSIDDVDRTFLNGVEIGQTGRFPDDPGGYDSRWQAVREYYVDLDRDPVRWDRDNVIAIRVYDGGGPGGFYRDTPYLRMAEIVDGVRLDAARTTYRYAPGRVTATVHLANTFPADLTGRFRYELYDAAAHRVVARRSRRLDLSPGGSATETIAAPQRAGIELRYHYVEATSGKAVTAAIPMPYLLTPPEPPQPRINGARMVGARPGSPFLFRIPATGRPPLAFSAEHLPPGLELDTVTGIVTGRVSLPGNYHVVLRVANPLGVAVRPLEIRVGATLALTPAMGWNSWNAYGLSVNDARVRAAADAFVRSGLAAHGWTYINIDDGWEAEARAPDGTIRSNAKFPDMKALGDYLHARGLRFGIYSSPGPRTCGGFLGSWEHERQDAESYAAWGIDYLKYDLCSYEQLMSKTPTLEEHQRPYRLMHAALRDQTRDIVFSLCQYGRMNVWTWGADVGGNSWRTTGDIEDTWESVTGIAARQVEAAPFAGPGHWNDPDMLVVGVVGWGGAPHPSRLTPDEQYSHISLWSLLAAPLLLGNDLTRLDPFTLNLLTN